MKNRVLSITSCLIAFAILIGWPRVKTSTAATFSEISNPAAPGSLAPSLSATPHGQIILNWIEPSGQGQALRFSIRSQRGWSAVQTVIRRPDFAVYAEAPPAILKLENGTILSVWAQTRKGTGKWPGNYLYAAASQDGGKVWSAPVRIHSDASDSEHSFSSIAATGPDRATAIWLDARDFESSHRYRLMSAVVTSTGEVKQEQTIDNDVCTCCPTAFVRTTSGAVAAYRGRNPQEIRDIKVSRLADGTWQSPRTVHDDGWHINGCPVNGPALSAHARNLAALWFTAMGDTPQVKLAFSEDLGSTFQPPAILDSVHDEARPVGHVAITFLEDGSALAAWLRQASPGTEIVAQRVAPGGPHGPLQVLAKGSTKDLGYPRMQCLGESVMISWGGSGDLKSVKTALVSVKGP